MREPWLWVTARENLFVVGFRYGVVSVKSIISCDQLGIKLESATYRYDQVTWESGV